MKRGLSMGRLMLALVLAVTLCFGTVKNAYAATYYYAEYGVSSGVMAYETRVRYCVSKTTPSTEYGSYETVRTHTQEVTPPSTVTLSHSETETKQLSISASIPMSVLESVVPSAFKSLLTGSSLSVGKTYSSSKTTSVSAPVTLTKKGQVAKLQVRYVTETTVKTLTCQRQQKDVYGNWQNKGSSYTKKVTTKKKYPDSRVVIS